MLKLLFVSSTSACFEFQNNEPYYKEKEYNVLLNGHQIIENKKENVFSIFNLEPKTHYIVEADGEKVEFCTESETAVINVRELGAKGDGEAEDTIALQTAINICPKGARVYIPEGNYLTAPLFLKSNLTLELAKGARLVGFTDMDKYPILPAKVLNNNGDEKIIATWEGEALSCRAALLCGYDIENVQIVGEGIIDGNAQNGVWWTDEVVKNRSVCRPRLVFLNRCENVVFHGITGQNGASWNFHPFFSKNIFFYDIFVKAPKISPNTDGLNPEACENVDIIGCRFSVGDDCIAIKSGKIDIAMKYQQSADKHTIRNCLMQYGHGAVVLGSEIAGGVKNLTVSKCVFEQTDRGLRIKTRRGRSKYCVIDGVEFDNIRMIDVLTPLVINMFYYCDPDGRTEYVWSREKLPIDDRTPRMGEFTFKNIRCTGCNIAAGYFDGLPEQPIEKISIQNVSFDFAEDAVCDIPAMLSFVPKMSRAGLYLDNVNEVNLKNVTFNNVIGDTIIRKNCKNINIED